MTKDEIMALINKRIEDALLHQSDIDCNEGIFLDTDSHE